MLFVYDSIDSTNASAKTLAAGGATEGTVVIADHQTAGRGRSGRTWLAEPGSSLLFSIIIRPACSIDKVGLLPYVAAAGIADAVETLTGRKCECKWPNDILMSGKKCCGILMESSFQNTMLEYVVIGIGLNVNQKIFPQQLGRTATSLLLETGKEFDRRAVFCQIMASLESRYIDAGRGDFDHILKEWKARASIFGKRITLTQASHTIGGIALDLTDDGGLLVETDTTRRVFHAGDVTITGKIRGHN